MPKGFSINMSHLPIFSVLTVNKYHRHRCHNLCKYRKLHCFPSISSTPSFSYLKYLLERYAYKMEPTVKVFYRQYNSNSQIFGIKNTSLPIKRTVTLKAKSVSLTVLKLNKIQISQAVPSTYEFNSKDVLSNTRYVIV